MQIVLSTDIKRERILLTTVIQQGDGIIITLFCNIRQFTITGKINPEYCYLSGILVELINVLKR